MNANAYQVILSGDLAEGATIEEVRRRMAVLFKTAEHKIDVLLKKKNPVIKRNIDMETASKYRRAIENTGAICRVEPMVSDQAPAGGQTEKPAAEASASATGPNVVPIQMLYRGEERFFPQELERIAGTPNGLNLNLPGFSDVAFNRIGAISAFSDTSGEETTRLLLFTTLREKPFICGIESIFFADFPIQQLAKPLATFRNFLHFLCRQNPAVILEETTFDFLSGSTLPRLNATELQKLATAIGKLIESGEAE